MMLQLTLPNQEKKEVWLLELLKQAKQTILYFYPKDNTPGCSLEARDFSQNLQLFLDKEIQVIGVSRDSEKSHCNFIVKQGLVIPLISDPDLLLHKQFWARGEKKNYGKIYEGTIRSTFLLDQDWKILQEWKNVKATGHVARLIKELGL